MLRISLFLFFLLCFFVFFSLLLFLTAVLFGCRRKLCMTHCFFFFFSPAQSLSVGRKGWKSYWKSDVTWRQRPHESQEKGLYEGKGRTSKTHTGEKRLIIFFFFLLPHSSYFLLILPVPMVVRLHEHLTHGSSLGCGGVISEPSQMPSL